MQLLVFLCSEDDEPICSKLCCEHIGLLEVLGSYLQSYTEHESKIIEIEDRFLRFKMFISIPVGTQP